MYCFLFRGPKAKDVHYLDTNHCNDVPYIRDTLGTWQFPSQEPSCVFPKIDTWFSKCVWRDSGDVRSVGCSNMNHICKYLIQEGGNDEGHSKKNGSVWFRHGKLQGNMLFPSIHFGENFCWCSDPNLDPGGVPLRTGLSENRVPQNPLVYHWLIWLIIPFSPS